MNLLKKLVNVVIWTTFCVLSLNVLCVEASPIAIDSQSFVFHIPEYDKTQQEAQQACEAAGARLATLKELEFAQQLRKAEWCSAGWLSDRGAPAWPMQSYKKGCGGPGIVWGLDSGGRAKAGANCFSKLSSLKDFNLVIMGDPQFFRTQHGSKHSDNNPESHKINRWQVDAIKMVPKNPGKFVGVIINGDLTEFGHNANWNGDDKEQFSTYRNYYVNGGLPERLWPGLGNHDYANNVNHCYENNCAMRMVHYMGDVLSQRHGLNSLNLVSKDFKDETPFPGTHRWITGSLSYAWDIGDYRFIQLHNFPAYKTQFDAYHWENPWWPQSRNLIERTVEIQSSIDNGWLKKQLDEATTAQKKVILNMHYTSSDNNSTRLQERQKLDQLMKGYNNIQAVFVGHIHYNLGQCGDHSSSDTIGNSVPIYNSGNPIYSTMLVANFNSTTGISVDRYSTNNGIAQRLGSAAKTCRRN